MSPRHKAAKLPETASQTAHPATESVYLVDPIRPEPPSLGQEEILSRLAIGQIKVTLVEPDPIPRRKPKRLATHGFSKEYDSLQFAMAPHLR